MNVKLRKNLAFTAGLIYEESFMINEYSCSVELLTVTDDHHEQNVAYDRIKGWVMNVLDGSIIIHSENPNLSAWQSTGARIMSMPEEPVDQIVGIMLYLKLNAMMENRMVATAVEVSSSQGDGMWYRHDAGDNVGTHFGTDGWWVDPRPNWSGAVLKKRGKVVNLDRQPEWSDFKLEWSQNDREKQDSVVFADFRRDEDK